jgi:putative tryptophan/tyrosine transport system substrate-binding protein
MFPKEIKMRICFRGAVWVAALATPLLLVCGPSIGAQQVPHVLVVGPVKNYGPLIAGVAEGLQSAGFGASGIQIDYRNASSPDEAKAAVGAAIDTDVNAMVTIFGLSTQAASAATTKIPIIFCPVADPVAAKLVASTDAPGGNLTGVASADAAASRRRLGAFRQVLPKLKRVAVLFDSSFPPDRVQMANLEQVAPAAGIALLSRAVDDENAVIGALRSLGPGDADAILILKDSLLREAGEELKSAALDQKLPILVGDPDLATFPGVLAAVGPNQRELGRICGRTTARILHGASPATLPIEHTSFELLVNLKSAAHLGIVVPERALKQAVSVIR